MICACKVNRKSSACFGLSKKCFVLAFPQLKVVVAYIVVSGLECFKTEQHPFLSGEPYRTLFTLGSVRASKVPPHCSGRFVM